MEMFRRVRGPVALATCLVICSSAGIAAETKPAINLDMAKKMVAACEAKAMQEGWKMNIAVVDDGANLVAFERMDGAYLGSVLVAQHKAMTSANFPFSTRQFSELAFGKEGKPGMVPGIANFPGIVTFAGGLPIMTAHSQRGKHANRRAEHGWRDGYGHRWSADDCPQSRLGNQNVGRRAMRREDFVAGAPGGGQRPCGF